MTKEELFELTNIDPWWLAQLEELHLTGWGGVACTAPQLGEGMGPCSSIFRNTLYLPCKHIRTRTHVLLWTNSPQSPVATSYASVHGLGILHQIFTPTY
jgi:hypothetical protein